MKQAVYDLVSLCYKLVLEFRLALSVDRAREAQAKLSNEDMFGILDSLFCGATSHKILGGSDMLKAVFRDVTEYVIVWYCTLPSSWSGLRVSIILHSYTDPFHACRPSTLCSINSDPDVVNAAFRVVWLHWSQYRVRPFGVLHFWETLRPL